MPTTVLHLDTLDDRREIHELLRQLAPARRIAFLNWCLRNCCQSIMPTEKSVVARKTVALAKDARWDSSADERLTMEAYTDVWFLCINHKLDIDRALAKLVEMVKRDTRTAYSQRL